MCTNLYESLYWLEDTKSKLEMEGDKLYIVCKTGRNMLFCIGNSSYCAESLNEIIYRYYIANKRTSVIIGGEYVDISKARFILYVGRSVILYDDEFNHIAKYVEDADTLYGSNPGPVIRLTNGMLIFGDNLVTADCSGLGPDFKLYKTASMGTYKYLSDGQHMICLDRCYSNIQAYIITEDLTTTEPADNYHYLYKIGNIYVCALNALAYDLKTVKYKEVFIRSASALGSRTKPALRGDLNA